MTREELVKLRDTSIDLLDEKLLRLKTPKTIGVEELFGVIAIGTVHAACCRQLESAGPFEIETGERKELLDIIHQLERLQPSISGRGISIGTQIEHLHVIAARGGAS